MQQQNNEKSITKIINENGRFSHETRWEIQRDTSCRSTRHVVFVNSPCFVCQFSTAIFEVNNVYINNGIRVVCTFFA